MVVHDSEQRSGCQIPNQNKTGDITTKHLTATALCFRKCRLCGIEADCCHPMARHRAWDDIHPEPPLFSIHLLREREAATGKDLRALLTEVPKRLFGQRNRVAHR